MNGVSPARIARLERCHEIAAECASENPELIPVFQRIEQELGAARTALINDPIARARRIAEQRRAASK